MTQKPKLPREARDSGTSATADARVRHSEWTSYSSEIVGSRSLCARSASAQTISFSLHSSGGWREGRRGGRWPGNVLAGIQVGFGCCPGIRVRSSGAGEAVTIAVVRHSRRQAVTVLPCRSGRNRIVARILGRAASVPTASPTKSSPGGRDFERLDIGAFGWSTELNVGDQGVSPSDADEISALLQGDGVPHLMGRVLVMRTSLPITRSCWVMAVEDGFGRIRREAVGGGPRTPAQATGLESCRNDRVPCGKISDDAPRARLQQGPGGGNFARSAVGDGSIPELSGVDDSWVPRRGRFEQYEQLQRRGAYAEYSLHSARLLPGGVHRSTFRRVVLVVIAACRVMMLSSRNRSGDCGGGLGASGADVSGVRRSARWRLAAVLG